MRIACIGGGPGGLYFAALIKQLDASHEVTVYERNAPEDTFGFGVVLSDETLGGIEHADPHVYQELSARFAQWDDIDIHYRGTLTTSGGHGFAAIDRRRLLQILRRRCEELGVRLWTRTEAPPVEDLARGNDLVVAADGINSHTRATYAEDFGTTLDQRHNTFMWLGTDRVFDAFNFHILHTPHGVMQLHSYPYSDTASTFIVEMHAEVWRRAGFADLTAGRAFPPGVSDVASIARCEELFSDVLEGHRLLPNNSKWQNFVTVRNESWSRGNVVLLGDAAHTAHFSIGSGTKLAMEDALALAACLHERPDVPRALAAYEEERRPVVASTQRAAQASLEWFEEIARHAEQDPPQFAFNLLTRSRRVTYDNLRLRDPEFVATVDDWFADQVGDGPSPTVVSASPTPDAPDRRPPMFHPFRLRELELRNRVVVSAMDMYSSQDGEPNDFHLVHLGSKAMGGAGLVMTEMVCVSPTGRITPGCTGLYRPEHETGWRRVTDFVHDNSGARIGVQLGHSGRKGSTRLMWEGIDLPLDEGNWPVVAPSALPYRHGTNQVPAELDHDGMRRIREEFVAAARRADAAGFDLLELHCAHGYLLSSFLSPVTNQRSDAYGGSLDARLRYPLEVFAAVREVWPDHKPMSVRISATDWVPEGTTGEDAVSIARAFVSAGADVIDVSTGQVTPDEKPAFGRSYQVPFAERIRSEIGVPTIAVGAISSYDDVNSTLLSGRADLCALGRPHLYDPHWTLHAAAEQEYSGPGVEWPAPFRAGSRRPQTGRTDGPRPRLEPLRSPEAGATAHRRWLPARPPVSAPR
ncbi:bifunctional salicylyl-CoA 5-hydroxylase/oxidoreductase [Spiractinospora alimapuensis]|uniref:bifunctional salicylyl-CoA 5-hydroxylase/oxidoreductase n=1 Tax=Spiractinospora alimapuensis TaxID=2820884 RepID=UPI001EE9B936|nr:bifunctional salicylyl-CoA 5-hydroxylase/oxidoreductase [Spiractinospora alimapuensis]QVQ53273.1 bifunctional salicylyl-CoA 5-hydroxylase/oxidoreductase [Spiractinospora alimapuensis]